MDPGTLRALAEWADADLASKVGELDHYYWGYDAISDKLRAFADRLEAHSSFDRQDGDPPLG